MILYMFESLLFLDPLNYVFLNFPSLYAGSSLNIVGNLVFNNSLFVLLILSFYVTLVNVYLIFQSAVERSFLLIYFCIPLAGLICTFLSWLVGCPLWFLIIILVITDVLAFLWYAYYFRNKCSFFHMLMTHLLAVCLLWLLMLMGVYILSLVIVITNVYIVTTMITLLVLSFSLLFLTACKLWF